MSYSVDVNILVYASDASSPFHPAARRFLEDRARDPDLFLLTWPVLMSYQRIVTHPGIFASPLSPGEALANLEALLALPRSRVVVEADGFVEVYREVSKAFPVRGNSVPDAHLAALLRQHGVRTIYTRDADFRKFPFLDVVDPL